MPTSRENVQRCLARTKVFITEHIFTAYGNPIFHFFSLWIERCLKRNTWNKSCTFRHVLNFQVEKKRMIVTFVHFIVYCLVGAKMFNNHHAISFRIGNRVQKFWDTFSPWTQPQYVNVYMPDIIRIVYKS